MIRRLLLLLAFAPGLAFAQSHEQNLSKLGIPMPANSVICNPSGSTAPATTCSAGAGITIGSGQISATGSSSTFGTITGGTNIAASMLVGTGASLATIGSGTISATTAAALASAPSQCSGGQFATGITSAGNANCSTASGSGNVSTSGSPSSGQLSTWASGTTIGGVTIGSEALVGNSGSGIAALSPSTSIGLLNSGTANSQTGTTYTLVAGDANGEVTMSNASANTLTIPANASVAFANGTIITVQALGAGMTTVAPASGVTIQSPVYGSSSTQTYSLGGIYGFIQLQKIATNTWNLITWITPFPILNGTLIANLPSCNAAEEGATAYVTNGVTSPTFLGTVSTTGSTVAPVFCNGSAWVYH